MYKHALPFQKSLTQAHRYHIYQIKMWWQQDTYGGNMTKNKSVQKNKDIPYKMRPKRINSW